MPFQEVRTYVAGPLPGQQFTKKWVIRNWVNSGRVNGKLRLASHPYQYQLREYRTLLVDRENAHDIPLTAPGPLDVFYEYQLGIPELKAESYARFRGKLYKGSAALGVTIGSYKQSRSMIVDRFKQLGNRVDSTLAKFATTPSHKKAKLIASTHLEIIFGWVPLLQDIHAAANTVIQQSAQTAFVSARAKNNFRIAKGWRKFQVSCMVTRSARIEIGNPNTWLAERAGLLNPAAVAWDLVPWSFVVNMFVNTGQLVNSITDFAGLNFHESTITVTRRIDGTYISTPKTMGIFVSIDKSREYGADERPPLVFKIPDASWETAAMAASLFTQKFARLVPLIQRARKTYTE